MEERSRSLTCLTEYNVSDGLEEHGPFWVEGNVCLKIKVWILDKFDVIHGSKPYKASYTVVVNPMTHYREMD